MIDLTIKIFICLFFCFIVILMIIKRFVYFRPTSNFIKTFKNYTPIYINKIYGWKLENSNNNKVILFCHGNKGNISHREWKYNKLQNLGYNIITFDYSGYGKSSGVPSEEICYDNAGTYISFILQTYKIQDIILYGESLGGAVASYVARKYNIPTLILESTFPSIKSLIFSRTSKLSFLSFLFPEFNTCLYLDGYKGRSLLLHSIDDDVISYNTIIELLPFVTKHIQMSGIHNNVKIPWNSVKEFIDN